MNRCKFQYLILVVGYEGDVDHLLLADTADEAVGVEGGAVDAHAVAVHRAPAARAVVAPLLVTLLAKHLQAIIQINECWILLRRHVLVYLSVQGVTLADGNLVAARTPIRNFLQGIIFGEMND